MKIGAVNNSTIVNRFVRHTLQRNITHLAVITRKTNIKLGILKGLLFTWSRGSTLTFAPKIVGGSSHDRSWLFYDFR